MTNEEVMRRIKDLQRTRGFGTREAQRDFYALEVVAGAFLEMEKRGYGEWIYKEFDEETGISNSYFCSHCDFPLTGVYNSYCAVCGARMVKK